MSHLNIYKDNPTPGSNDGVLVSKDYNVFSSPIQCVLDATINESAIIQCAVRTDPGFIASDVVIYDIGDTNNHCKLSADIDYGFHDSITFPSVNNTNYIFYIKFDSNNTELPQSNRAIKLRCCGKVRRGP